MFKFLSQTFFPLRIGLTFCSFRMYMKEKKFKCTICHSRFERKNAAKRHEDSVHLRPRSWSCVAISKHEAAFYPLSSLHCQMLNGPSNDVCGYCGERFSNFPCDMEARSEHLTHVHRFNTCKRTKFFRLDHFRQHLILRHNGKNGHWIHELENACMNDE